MSHFCAAAAILGLNVCEGDSAITLTEKNFINHMAEFGLSYATKEEYEFRMGIFATLDATYSEINANPENTFEVGHNQFSTMTDAEFMKMLGDKVEEPVNETEFFYGEPVSNGIDWRSKGAVNAVKNQGACGSCWAFSAVASIEAHHFIKSGKLVSLSEQQLVDCDKTSHGCNGGSKNGAMAFTKTHGLATETQYPYTAKNGVCKSI